MDQYERESRARYDLDKAVIQAGPTLTPEKRIELERRILTPVRVEGSRLLADESRKVESSIRNSVYSELKRKMPYLKLEWIRDPKMSRSGSQASTSTNRSAPSAQGPSKSGVTPGQVLDLSKVKAVEEFPGPGPKALPQERSTP